ncbi:Lrp/AsnC family transcriptional regulator [Jeotgalibacillus marinus]|uniref:Lrp/AsnC family transcriptional regulator n=1 Tax=Jeotgalibacillus marinus TaxID=86667 RepID=A0ABV3Q8G3_9BACL
MKIDQIDKRILNELNQNSRMSMRELGKRINMSSPAVNERVKQMESFGVIKGYTLNIDHEKAGYPVSCIVEATIKNGEYNLFKRHIKQMSNVEFCYRIAGNACFILKLHFEKLSKVEEFIDSISPIAETVTHVVFSSVETDSTI